MTAARIGVVLAGGRATRMGGDKAGALLDGQTLLQRAVDTIRAAGLEPRICARAPTTLPAIEGLVGDAIWREPTPDAAAVDHAHPLAGLAYAARQAGEPIVAFPVDLPLLPAQALASLARHDAPLGVLGVDGRAAALVAKLLPSHAAALAAAADANAPSLGTLLALGAEVIELDALAPGADPVRSLTNVNSPDDLAAVARLL